MKLGNITTHTHARNAYAEYFGFNDDDIDSLCVAIRLPDEVRKKAKAWLVFSASIVISAIKSLKQITTV